jgi:hypothetical protein
MPNHIGARTAFRRTLSIGTLMAFVAGAAIAATACDSDQVTSLTVGPGGTDRAGSISDNHGHVATLSAGQLAAGNALTIDIRGTADHSHTVELGGAEVVQIRNSQRVTTTSSTETSATFGTHSHTVTFN